MMGGKAHLIGWFLFVLPPAPNALLLLCCVCVCICARVCRPGERLRSPNELEFRSYSLIMFARDTVDREVRPFPDITCFIGVFWLETFLVCPGFPNVAPNVSRKP